MIDCDAIILDLKKLTKAALADPAPLRISWSDNGTARLDLVATFHADYLRLSVIGGPVGYGGLEVFQEIRLVQRPCPFGGHRSFFVCDEAGCGRNAMRMVFDGNHFVCGHCAQLRYRTKSLGRFRRLERQVERLAARLGSSRAHLDQIERPKGMWQRTFARRVARLAKAQAELNDANRTLLGRFRMQQKMPAP